MMTERARPLISKSDHLKVGQARYRKAGRDAAHTCQPQQALILSAHGGLTRISRRCMSGSFFRLQYVTKGMGGKCMDDLKRHVVVESKTRSSKTMQHARKGHRRETTPPDTREGYLPWHLSFTCHTILPRPQERTH
jgi:hypothetical protein